MTTEPLNERESKGGESARVRIEAILTANAGRLPERLKQDV
jgi:hypothetical protein